MRVEVMQHYGLTRPLDQAGYFETAHHKQLLKDMRGAILEGKLIAVCGVVGSGKTVTMRRLQQILRDDNRVTVSKSLTVEKQNVRLPTLIAALFYDLSPDNKQVQIPKQGERRERELRELVKRGKRPIALFIDEAHDLSGHTLTGLKRLMEVVEDGDGLLSVVLSGHPKLRNDLRKPTMEEIGYRTAFFTLDGIAGQQREYIEWVLTECTNGKTPVESILTDDAIKMLAEKLRTPLQIQLHLTFDRSGADHRRHHRSAQGGDLPDRCQADAQSPRTPGALGEEVGVPLRQSYERVGRLALMKQGRYAHAKQHNRAKREFKRLKTILGRVVRDIRRKIAGNEALVDLFRRPLWLAERVATQKRRDPLPKIYSLHASEVECIGKGKAAKPYEFGCKVTIATTNARAAGGQFVVHIDALHGNPHDGHTLKAAVEAAEAWTGVAVKRIYVDKGYQGHHMDRFKVWRSGNKAPTAAIRRELRRRSAIEPAIGHMKSDGRLGRNFLIGKQGDRIDAILCGAGHNFRLPLRWLRLLLLKFLDGILTIARQSGWGLAVATK